MEVSVEKNTTNSSETWEDLGKSVTEAVNKELKERKQQTMKCFDKALAFPDVEPERFNQVVTAINAGIDRLGLIKLQNNKTMELGIGRKTCKGNIEVIHFNVNRGSRQPEVVKDINDVITHANNILATFEKPLVPELNLQ